MKLLTRKHADSLALAAASFLAAGFTGWVYEVAITWAALGEYVPRGFLPVPVLPIYGVFALVLPLFFKDDTPWYKVFIWSTIVSTVFELVCSYIIDAVLGYRLWDYSLWPLNFEERISLFSSLIFGALAVLFRKGIYPLLKRLQGKNTNVFGITAAAVLVVIAAIALIRR